MGSGVYHRVANVVFGQIRVIGLAVKCELENTHSRQMKFIAERVYIRCDQPLGPRR